MKRELNSRSRRKWVAGGVLVFGSVALLSTGFATWLVGVQKTFDTGEIEVSVETMNAQMFRVSVALTDNSLKVGEKAAVSNGVVTETGAEGDWQVFGTITVLKNGNTAPSTTVSATLPESYDDIDGVSHNVNAINKLTVSANGTGNNATGKHTVGAEQHYINTTGTVSPIVWGNGVLEGSLYKFEAPLTITFDWGDYYGSAGLAAFYNGEFNIETITGDDIDNIKTERDTMNTVLTGGNLTVYVTVANS